MVELQGFDDPNLSPDENEEVKKKSTKKSGGFQSMGLSFNLLKGITKRGYKIPTPIQRKAIPLVLEGRDVVAMARTGSGKTACFLIPMFERLKIRSAKTGARALILSPTRELALQTLRFIKELGRFSDLKASVILGGDSMEDQFSAIHGNPDILVATPGRFLHVCVEMDLKLKNIEYIVFDEADRLFEMGFGEQLNEIVNRLPDSRQTVLFSATLPKVLVEFAKAGLNDPVLIRLDVESKLPTGLQLWFITCRPEEKLAALIVLLKSHIEEQQQTLVFAATKHHVEYVHMILDHFGISNTYIYSNLDPSARKINAAKFSQGKCQVLVVTDVAARGIDIPQLDNVINFNFPAKSKLFLHRVGRCARAGRSGTAYSLVSPDEHAYLLDLHLFLDTELSLTLPTNKEGSVGRMPQSLIEEQHSALLTLHETRMDIASMKKVTENAYQQYLRSRPAASSDSNKRIKELPLNSVGVHSIFRQSDGNDEENDRENIIDRMKVYRPQGTIFEICGKNTSQDYQVMKKKRAFHKEKIEIHHQKRDLKKTQQIKPESTLQGSNAEEIEDTFATIVVPKKRKIDDLYKQKAKKPRKEVQKDDNYIPYQPADRHTEEGLSVNFQQEASKAQLDLTADTKDAMRRSNQTKVWDRKKKKFVVDQSKSKVGKIKTESGVWIPATYKSNRYSQWKDKTKQGEAASDDDGDNTEQAVRKPKDFLKGRPNTHWARHNEKQMMKNKRSDLKSTDQILKARQLAEKKKSRQNGKRGKKGKKSGGGGGGRSAQRRK